MVPWVVSMYRAVFYLGVVLIFVFMPLFAHAALFVPFGGQIAKITPCPFNPSASLVLLKGFTQKALVYQSGASFSYREGPPVHPGQWLLGVYTTSLGGVSCPVPGAHIAGLIRFHGSSK